MSAERPLLACPAKIAEMLHRFFSLKLFVEKAEKKATFISPIFLLYNQTLAGPANITDKLEEKSFLNLKKNKNKKTKTAEQPNNNKNAAKL